MRRVHSRDLHPRAAPAPLDPSHVYPTRSDASPSEAGGPAIVPGAAVAHPQRPINDRPMPLKEVQRKVALGSSTIYRRIAKGTFPKPLHLSPGCVRWRESTIDAWINELQTVGPKKNHIGT